jgi:small subunit ribosomal protein S18
MARFKGPRSPRRKFCKLCFEKITHIDYKDERKLQRFLTDHGKIVPRRVSGACSRHQAQVTRAIKRARVLALLPYTTDHFR